MKSRQFCSVCKEWLEMEVVPTSDGDDDDGVIWFRCPQCQGFLPKLSGADLNEPDSATAESDQAADKPEKTPVDQVAADVVVDVADGAMPWDSPADMMAAQGTPEKAATAEPDSGDPFLPEDDDVVEASGATGAVQSGGSGTAEIETSDKSAAAKDDEKPSEPTEPIHEYLAMLADLEVTEAAPYRPWESYEVGQCLHHLAWGECGVVVAKEDLPGGRKVIKCFFEDAGVVRLIEQAPR